MKSVFQLIATLACAVALTACGAAANTEKPVVLDPNTQVPKLTVSDVVVGTGLTAEAGDTLDVLYTGWLYDASKPDNKGKQFETNMSGPALPFQLGKGLVILGWDRGLVGMKVGGTRILSIPYDLGYGKVGKPTAIPGYAGLLFEVKLIGVTKK